jgi:signal peptidase I
MLNANKKTFGAISPTNLWWEAVRTAVCGVAIAAAVHTFVKDDLIKRIIGLPGDTIQIQSGKVFVNGKSIAEPYLQERPDYNYGPVTIPQNQYFVLGDNRNHSYDSHLWGFLLKENLIGRAAFRFYPVGRIGSS